MHRIFRRAAEAIRARLRAGWPASQALVVGLLCAGAPFGFARPALGQTLPFAQVPEPVPADSAPAPSEAPTVDAAEVMAQSQRRAELAKLREEFEA